MSTDTPHQTTGYEVPGYEFRGLVKDSLTLIEVLDLLGDSVTFEELHAAGLGFNLGEEAFVLKMALVPGIKHLAEIITEAYGEAEPHLTHSVFTTPGLAPDRERSFVDYLAARSEQIGSIGGASMAEEYLKCDARLRAMLARTQIH